MVTLKIHDAKYAGYTSSMNTNERNYQRLPGFQNILHRSYILKFKTTQLHAKEWLVSLNIKIYNITFIVTYIV